MNIYFLIVLLLLLSPIFFILVREVVSPALGKKLYWEVVIKIATLFIIFGILCFFFTSVQDCNNEAIFIAALITTLFLPIILICRKTKERLKGGMK